MRNRIDLAIGSAALYYRLLTGSFFGEGERGRREIGKDDKSKDGESFGNKGIASCPVSYRIDLLNEDLLLT